MPSLKALLRDAQEAVRHESYALAEEASRYELDDRRYHEETDPAREN